MEIFFNQITKLNVDKNGEKFKLFLQLSFFHNNNIISDERYHGMLKVIYNDGDVYKPKYHSKINDKTYYDMYLSDIFNEIAKEYTIKSMNIETLLKYMRRLFACKISEIIKHDDANIIPEELFIDEIYEKYDLYGNEIIDEFKEKYKKDYIIVLSNK